MPGEFLPTLMIVREVEEGIVRVVCEVLQKEGRALMM
jgi:hypothetical protein